MLFWLLWLVVVAGGFYMAAGYGLSAFRNGFEISNVANAVLYFGCALYGSPKFVRFLLKKSVEIIGIDPVLLSVRGIHALMAAAWLLFDFVVFWLHFKVKDAAAPVEERLERARVMHGIDTVVAYVFLLMFPTGLILCWLTGTPVFSTGWLSWKHLMYAVIVTDALYLLPISGAALRNLKAIKSGAENVDELNIEISRKMNQAMPAVWLVWALVFAASLLSVLNLRAPSGQEYIFRKTEAAVQR